MKNLLIRLLTVGRMKDVHLEAKCAEYLKRLNAYAKVEVVEVKDSNPEEEGAKLLRLFDPARELVLALGEEGETFTSGAFAGMLESAGRRVVLIVGGPYGLSDEVKRAATRLVSLSPLTFTHELARAVLLEQLFRACSIINHTGYHH
ncbi:MAG: 23S rRNA (pseudouridine(1915)-N(3))-methyltransferase RlmH [Victivallaceae bacterium]|nr:23S rRNA (pseudouridine(1915)-N(3))-methyltransferase RlmH [Victivallaceae bacterium]